jgi:hypothetical protein
MKIPLSLFAFTIPLFFLAGQGPVSAAPAAGLVIQPITAAKIADLARSVRNLADLSAAAHTACNVQPWQVVFADDGMDRVRIQRSPTMPATQAKCVFSLAAQTRYRVTNSPSQR